MTPKPITKKYLTDRTSFKDKTVLFSTDLNGLWDIIKQLDPEDQRSVFKVVEREINPLSEDQIDSLFAYLPNEVRAGLDFISMDKIEKLGIVRKNKETLNPIIQKKGFSERIGLDRKKVIPKEEYSSANLWNIVKTGKYDLS